MMDAPTRAAKIHEGLPLRLGRLLGRARAVDPKDWPGAAPTQDGVARGLEEAIGEVRASRDLLRRVCDYLDGGYPIEPGSALQADLRRYLDREPPAATQESPIREATRLAKESTSLLLRPNAARVVDAAHELILPRDVRERLLAAGRHLTPTGFGKVVTRLVTTGIDWGGCPKGDAIAAVIQVIRGEPIYGRTYGVDLESLECALRAERSTRGQRGGLASLLKEKS